MPLFHQKLELRSASSAKAVPNVLNNILIVGETGVGKSSLVNLIAGKQLAEVYSVPGTDTREATLYDVTLQDRQGHGHHIRLFDTVGLNEPYFENRDYLSAIEKTNALICQLQRTGGIHLLLFCLRADAITATTKNSFRLLSDILCQNKVPVALVITCLENEGPAMDDWWKKNESFLKTCGLACTSHACVTTIRGRNDRCVEEYHQSQTTMRALLLSYVTGSFAPCQPQQTNRLIVLAGKLMERLGGRQWLDKKMLALNLQKKCKFTQSDAEHLATKILTERMKSSD